MASPEERARLRRNVGEVGSSTYTDAELDVYINEAGDDLDVAAATIWQEKAASYAELVDIAEAGSSRKNSDLYKNAIDMAAKYGVAAGNAGGLTPGTFSTTRAIVRP